ncbi:hypothetical protein Nham_2406 [Nitrobacter hamburgensis X14]|uniref:HTH HARE-type domain-containing protein n=2 Tax=Nitrobacter hamburgensis TaxID=912 RepID=Q1QKQ0_NITHX|nr:hypothetical protein Nham_0208 [Nitrobacter hamburgensis X14]ABE63197.1 hypothetical protein Nham_2406 [Nitrobacter hamburgensis X14]
MEKCIEISVAGEPDSPYTGEVLKPEADSMSKTVDQVISELAAEITAEEASLRKKKETVNTLCGAIGRPPAYSLESAATALPTQIRSDQFYGQPLAASVRTILEMRRAQNLGAAANREIYDSLVAGGYEFDTKSEDIAQKSLRNSLAKNTALFHKLPNGQFGLLAWYPNVKKPKASAAVRGEDEIEEPPTNDNTGESILD